MIEREIVACGLRVNFNRQQLKDEDYKQLLVVGKKKMILERFRDMIDGLEVNTSEHRAALHTSLRSFDVNSPKFEEVNTERKRMLAFADDVREGRWRGCRGNRITDVINIGIGGSDKGPHMVWHALHGINPTIRLHFLSTVDGILLDRILGACNPYSTLVVVSSKSFSTRETLVNASAVDQWLLDNGISGVDRNRHMVVVSAKPEATDQMCLPEANGFKIWNWVGGRFSLWGSIGLPLAVGLGPQAFLELLKGAEEMDVHTKTKPLEENLPAHMALVSYWNSVERNIPTHCILPYDERLRLLVDWDQQLEMESLGKIMSPNGTKVSHSTGQCIWGANGNEGQHSFYQWLREGCGSTSIDMLWSVSPGHPFAEHYRVLLSNAKAQAQALVTRDTSSDRYNVLTTIELDGVTPRRLGALLALYEHKTTMLGTLYDINPFDQPGVEYAKVLSKKLEKEFHTNE